MASSRPQPVAPGRGPPQFLPGAPARPARKPRLRPLRPSVIRLLAAVSQNRRRVRWVALNAPRLGTLGAEDKCRSGMVIRVIQNVRADVVRRRRANLPDS